MSGLSRRTMFKGSMAAASLFALDRVSGGRLVRAQGAAYEIISFGPIADGVLPDEYFWPQPGVVIGMHGSGTAFGRVAASADKFTPALFGADGTLTKLKSGEFGGSVTGINAAGNAAGFTYDTVAGVGEQSFTVYRQPAVWTDGELLRLPSPDPEYQGTDKVGTTIGIADDGTVLGNANGYWLLWTDGEPQILPRQDDAGTTINYSAITPDGSLIGYTSKYDSATETSTTVYGTVNGTTVEPFPVPEEWAGTGGFFRAMNSAGDILRLFIGSDLYTSIITNSDLDPVVIDHREEGVNFLSNAMNASHQVVGTWQPRAGVEFAPAIWEAGEFTPLESVLPANHGFHMITALGISDDGIIAGSGYDEEGGFHPLLFVPS